MRPLLPAHRPVSLASRAHALRTGALVVLALPIAAHAQAGRAALVPAEAPNCKITAPPEESGIAATPGGFVIVFPRNDALDARYTGCKLLWLADTDRTPRLATLYFERGALTRAVSHDVRDDAGAPQGACSFPDARALLPDRGGQPGDPACRGILDEPMYGLRLATWPRACLAKPEAAACTADPR